MSQLSRTYRLRRLTDSRDPDYAQAITQVYLDNIGPGLRTNSNEIAYWLDRSYREFGDDFYICVLYVDNKLVGFAEFALFRQQRVLLFDYLVLHKEYRSQGEYFQFARMLRDWVNAEQMEFDYFVADISYETATSQPSKDSLALVRLFKRIGLRVADCEYWQPPLGTDNPQSNMRSHLLLASRENITHILRDTLLQIVHTIYFHHHERWYSATLLDDTGRQCYHKLLTQRFALVERGMRTCPEIPLNGVKSLDPPLLSPKAPRAAVRPAVAYPIAVAIAIGIFCASFLVLQHFLQIAPTVIILLFGASLLVFVIAFAMFDTKILKILHPLLKFIKDLCGRIR